MVEAANSGELVARILAGEKAAESELVERYSRGVAIILHRATGDQSLAEDLSQETFQLTLEKIRAGEVREPEKLSGFICSLARNLATDHYRRSRRSEQVDDPEAVEMIAATAPSQLDRVLQAERSKRVRQLLSELSERDREILRRV
jgi:RNA polymerase sigma-70 factor (ECF subfamily)